MELEFVRWLREKTRPHPGVPVGIGDDAAILAASSSGDWAVTTDMLMDGVDFELSKVDPRRVGRKALAVNLSDLAAMAAEPVAAFVSVALPQAGGLRLAQELYEGIFALAAEFSMSVAGGDTNSWRGPLVINITAMGRVPASGPLLRTGARPGDAILVTGPLGGSILGHHFDFTPRVRESLQLARLVPLHAGIDISDGLTLDLARLTQASGCGAELDLSAVPVAESARRMAAEGLDSMTALDHALSDGEDFELILAVSPEDAEQLLTTQPLPGPLYRIGRFIPEPGLWSVAANGDRTALPPRGYEHTLL